MVIFRKVLDAARERSGSFAVLCIDFDRFKQINDLFGHSMGDAALREASRRLQMASQGAFLARIGGDEFIAITEQDPLPSSAELLADRLRGALDLDIEIDGHSFELDLSIGIAVYPRDGDDARSLFANADAALYRAKHEGRGRDTLLHRHDGSAVARPPGAGTRSEIGRRKRRALSGISAAAACQGRDHRI